MSDEDQGWQVDDAPEVTGCDLGQHEWEAADCDNCDNPECHVICANCDEYEFLCEEADANA